MVIDASVLADMFITSRPRHSQAVRLAQLIRETRLTPIVPMHAVLELKSAIDDERRTAGMGELDQDIFTEGAPLAVTQVAIDKKFLHEYYDLAAPFMRAGDLPYVLIAKKHGYVLVTEDRAQYQAAKTFGIGVYTIEEYLSESTK